MDIPEINRLVDKIANDRVSGASTIARNAAECLDTYAAWVLDNLNKISPEDYIKELISLGQNLVRAQPTMAPIINSVNEIISSTKHEAGSSERSAKTHAEKRLKVLCTITKSSARRYLVESKLALETIAHSYKDVLKSKDILMTISASSAVEGLLLEAFKDSLDFKVFVPESRPMYEGRLMAERLANKGVKIILIADHAMFHYLSECSSILIGADRVTPEGVINKIGTYGLAIAAKELKIPLYCISERMKFIQNVSPIENLIVYQPEEQIYPIDQAKNKPDKLNVKNIYFDFTPMSYISKFLTEDGLMTPKRVIDHIKTQKLMPELVSELKSNKK